MSSSLKTRLVTAVVAIPLLLAAIIFLPEENHLLFCFIIIAVNTLGTVELHRNMIRKVIDVPPTGYLGILLPVAELLKLRFLPEIDLTISLLAIFLSLTFLMEVKNGEKDSFSSSLLRSAAAVFNIVYPSLPMAYGIRLCYMTQSGTAEIITFLAIVFGSDTTAYFSGMLFGKNNRGIVKCSPNKSVAGFTGGTIGLASLVTAVFYFLPGVLPFTLPEIFILALSTAVAGTAGDLFESMLKRSAGVKDSGVAVPGRGGMLDCIDSISVALPVFVFIYESFLYL